LRYEPADLGPFRSPLAPEVRRPVLPTPDALSPTASHSQLCPFTSARLSLSGALAVGCPCGGAFSPSNRPSPGTAHGPHPHPAPGTRPASTPAPAAGSSRYGPQSRGQGAPRQDPDRPQALDRCGRQLAGRAGGRSVAELGVPWRNLGGTSDQAAAPGPRRPPPGAEPPPSGALSPTFCIVQEVDRFSKAFKDPEFLKLFEAYAQEVSDPKARAGLERGPRVPDVNAAWVAGWRGECDAGRPRLGSWSGSTHARPGHALQSQRRAQSKTRARACGVLIMSSTLSDRWRAHAMFFV
jgi:hypothetical protein